MDKGYAYEKLGLFYLGRELAGDGETEIAAPLLLKSKYLTTHAAIIGMTGSGKTGLGIGLLEEAIMDDIPSLVIDPKGDMGNLLLTFPDLAPRDFAPWIDPAEAEKEGMSPEEFAAQTAQGWREGLDSWGQGQQRIASLRRKTEFTIYTPGSSAGVPVSVLHSFAPPSPEVLRDSDTLNGLVDSLVRGLLALVNIEAETGSREYVLLASLFLHHWRKGNGLDMEGVIGNVVNPPFHKIGVFTMDVFYPQAERMALAMAFNGVLASPSFAGWLSGEPLDIQKILYGETGTPQTAIFSIAHLSEAERMFFVTMLLNRFIDWMRRQQGTPSLKALLYMDEIFGYFPPTANPPSKKPMLLLLKQARAYGIGVVLSTQNPVDLDYKGLANIGTWFVGRLQTVQDQNRVIDGIAGGAEGGREKKAIRDLLAKMGGRRFLLRSAHLDEVLLFETRWVMSYLKGPMALFDIEKLMKKRRIDGSDEPSSAALPEPAGEGGTLPHPPLIADAVRQRYHLHPLAPERYVFAPWLAASGRVRFYNGARNIDEVVEVSLRLPADERFTEPGWDAGEDNPYSPDELEDRPPTASSYLPLSQQLAALRNLGSFRTSFADYLYRSRRLELFRAEELDMESKPGESLADFKVRVGDRLRELKDEAIAALEDKHRQRQRRLEEKIERALGKVEKEKADVTARTTDTILSFGSAVVGAFFGRKRFTSGALSRAGTGIKNAGRLAREKDEVKRAEEALEKLQQEIEALAGELEEEVSLVAEQFNMNRQTLQTFAITPRRSDIFDLELFLLWEMVA